MTNITLDAIKAEHAKVAEMIAAFEAQAKFESNFPVSVPAPNPNPAKTILQPVDRGIDFVGQVIKPWRRVTRRRTFDEARRRVRSIDAGELFETANSYYGLLRQASHSHHDRAQLSNELRRRGHTIAGNLTKTFRRKPA